MSTHKFDISDFLAVNIQKSEFEFLLKKKQHSDPLKSTNKHSTDGKVIFGCNKLECVSLFTRVCRYSLVCVSARAFLQFPNISTGDLICRFQSSSAKNIELTFQPSAGRVTELCLQLALTRGPWLICVDKAARRSPPSLPPQQNPLLRRKQQQVSVSS